MRTPDDGTGGGQDPSDLLRLVLDHTPDFVSVISPEGRILDVNRTLPSNCRQDVVGRSLFDYVAPANHERVRACLAQVVATGRPGSYETEVRLLDGSHARFLTRVAPLGRPGEIKALGCISTDVTSLHAAYQALRESDEKLRIAVNASKLGIWTWAPGERPGDAHVHWDERCCAIYGLRPDEVPQTREDYLRLLHPDDVPIFLRHERALAEGRMEDIEYRIIRPDGSVRWVFGRGAMLFDQAGRLEKIVGGILDVTDQRELEQRLARAQQKESLANLTAGVAHNFNNLLMAILPNTERAMSLASPAQMPLLQAVRDASERAAALVKDLMLFAGQRPASERRPVAVAALVAQVVSLWRASTHQAPFLKVHADAGLPSLVINGPQIEQALLNLCLNARDAVEGRSDPSVTLRVQRVESRVRFSVADNGTGMTPEVQRQVFEPFFTTKAVGRGTGLGLSSAYAIARQHGGSLTCDSQPGAGSTFHLELPVDEVIAADEVVDDSPAASIQRQGSILVIDDDPMVRDIVARVLRGAGHHVMLADSGDEALALFQDAERPIGLVLLDAAMPGMPGPMVLKRLRARDPQVRVALFTGGDDRAMAADVWGVLHKPVSIEQLLGFVTRAMRS